MHATVGGWAERERESFQRSFFVCVRGKKGAFFRDFLLSPAGSFLGLPATMTPLRVDPGDLSLPSSLPLSYVAEVCCTYCGREDVARRGGGQVSSTEGRRGEKGRKDHSEKTESGEAGGRREGSQSILEK